jgi:voltage-gated potassium channel
MKIKHRLHHILYGSHPSNGPSGYFLIFISALILLNAISVLLETVESTERLYRQEFLIFEWVSVGIFSIEYVLRVWVADLTPFYQKPLIGRLRYMISPLALIDLMAIIPSLLSFVGVDLRILRLVRLLRLLKLTRYSRAMHNVSAAISAGKDELIFSALLMGLLLLISSSLMYYAEHEAQPQIFSSIPAAMWWGIVTLTTIGYGDIYPVTMVGKIITSFTAIFGIGLFALPGGVIVSELIAQVRKPACPHCGK